MNHLVCGDVQKTNSGEKAKRILKVNKQFGSLFLKEQTLFVATCHVKMDKAQILWEFLDTHNNIKNGKYYDKINK